LGREREKKKGGAKRKYRGQNSGIQTISEKKDASGMKREVLGGRRKLRVQRQ